MYRAGWGLKDEEQRRILAIDITREGFDWALSNSCPSHPGEAMSKEDWAKVKDASPVRIQWDPERDLLLLPMEHRTIQIGLSKDAVRRYANQWIRRISEVTPLAHEIHALVRQGRFLEAKEKLPIERPLS